MTWQSKVMPDDAPELAGSLVGTMLQATTTEECLAVELSGNPGELLLWEAMQIAYCADQSRADAYAAAIEAVRDWLLLDDPEPFDGEHGFYPHLPQELAEWAQRQKLRQALTEQAELARREAGPH